MSPTPADEDLFETAVAAHETGDLATAERIYRDLIESDAEDPVVEELLGSLLANTGRLDEAKTRLERSIRLDGSSATAHYALADLLLVLGETAAAERSLVRCLEIDASMRPALLRLGLLLADRDRPVECEELVARLRGLEGGAIEAGVVEVGLSIARGEPQKALELLGRLPDAVCADPALRFYETLATTLLDRHDDVDRLLRALPPEQVASVEVRVGVWLASHDRVAAAATWCFRRRAENGPDPVPPVLAALRVVHPERAHNLRRAVAETRFGNAAEDVLAGMACIEKGDSSGAAERLGRAVALHPDDPELLAMCASAFTTVGRADEALAMLEAADSRHGRHLAVASERARALLSLHRYRESEATLLQVHHDEPDNDRPLHGLVDLAVLGGRFDEALQWCDRIAGITGRDIRIVAAAESLAGSMRQGEALDRLDAESSRRIDHEVARQRLYLSNFVDDLDDGELLRRHRAFGDSIEDASPGRSDEDRRAALRTVLGSGSRIRIGFLSPDLRRHSVWYFLEPLLASLDRERFEVIGICDTALTDAVTERIRSCCDGWTSVAGASPTVFRERLAPLELDILVELAGHTSGNRLAELSRRIAPVQASWLGYPNTTGVGAIDFRIVDEHTDPIGSERFATETLLRMPHHFLCHLRPPELSDPAAADREGGPVFGSFNNLAKVTDTTIRAWSAVLREIPDARMLIKSKALREESTATRLRSRFESEGVPGERLDLRSWSDRVGDHLSMYREVDVALDTYPYHGTTTTCEALSMGVPVVCLVGASHRSRVGASLLAAIGRPEWSATDEEGFVAAAVDALGRRGETRRDLLKGTPLREPRRFAADFASTLEAGSRG